MSEGWHECYEGLDALEDEIRSFADVLQPSPSDDARVQQCLDAIQQTARGMLRDASAHLFGSQAVGLSTATSDMDVVLLSSFLGDGVASATAKDRNITFMYSFAAKLCPDTFRSVEVLAHTHIPIIKCTTSSGQKCDISVGMEGGIASARAMREAMNGTEEIRPLVLLIKQVLKDEALNEVYTGGLSSYAVFHLVLAAVRGGSYGSPSSDAAAATQRHGGSFPYFVRGAGGVRGHAEERGGDAGEDDTDGHRGGVEASGCELRVSMGKRLIEMLDLYGGNDGRFKPTDHAIHPARGIIPRKSTLLQYPPSAANNRRGGDPLGNRFATVDCADATNDVSRGCFRTWEVMNCFRRVANMLKRNVRGYSHSQSILEGVVALPKSLRRDSSRAKRSREGGAEDEGELLSRRRRNFTEEAGESGAHGDKSAADQEGSCSSSEISDMEHEREGEHAIMEREFGFYDIAPVKGVLRGATRKGGAE